jgi:hypothetical protein
MYYHHSSAVLCCAVLPHTHTHATNLPPLFSIQLWLFLFAFYILFFLCPQLIEPIYTITNNQLRYSCLLVYFYARYNILSARACYARSIYPSFTHCLESNVLHTCLEMTLNFRYYMMHYELTTCCIANIFWFCCVQSVRQFCTIATVVSCTAKSVVFASAKNFFSRIKEKPLRFLPERSCSP